MSLLLVQVVPEGILLGADRNITSEFTMHDGNVEVAVTGQSERPKVLKWPNHEVIVGYVGAGHIEGQPTDEWLYAFIGRHLEFPNLDALAQTLSGDLDRLFRAGDFGGPMILHLAGFEWLDADWTPRVHYIRNTTDLHPDGRYELGNRFECREELSRPDYFGNKRGSEIRDSLRTEVFTFRQGYDLGSFGLIAEALHQAMMVIIHEHPLKPHPAPTTLPEWRKHVAFNIHAYGAYFAAFYPPFEQYVGCRLGSLARPAAGVRRACSPPTDVTRSRAARGRELCVQRAVRGRGAARSSAGAPPEVIPQRARIPSMRPSASKRIFV
jgi:hypothetical protein